MISCETNKRYCFSFNFTERKGEKMNLTASLSSVVGKKLAIEESQQWNEDCIVRILIIMSLL
jgi:hypothetical protein